MALTYDEQIALEMQKIAKLKQKKKQEERKRLEEIGQRVVDRFPNVTADTIDDEINNLVAMLSKDDPICAKLGRLIMTRLPQYFSKDSSDSFENNVEKLAEFIELNE
ncbi:MAG: hypothetical protein MJ105_06990 [Lachnospiraceae bacterium]|nr:hypothetical protein [Lachnospiraceae bacterium]